MTTREKWRIVGESLLVGLVIFLCGWMLVGVSGCTTTITPDAVHATQASFDSGVQNSGFIGFFADGSGHLTPRARDRYNLLVSIYGKEYLPPLKRDSGIAALADGTFQIEAFHLSAFMVMSEKHRAGIQPIKP